MPPNELRPNQAEAESERAAPGAARSAADADLDRLVAAWPTLTAEPRAEILAVVDALVGIPVDEWPALYAHIRNLARLSPADRARVIGPTWHCGPVPAYED